MITPAMLGGIGSFLGGAGSILGGIIGGSSTSTRNYNSPRDLLRSQLKGASEAREFGFHPLSALGVSPSSGSIQRTVNDRPDFSAMGQGLSKVMRTPQQMKIARLQLEQERARLDNMRLRNLGLQRELTLGDTTTGPPASGIDTQTPISELANTPGLYRTEPLPKQAPGGGRQLGEQGAEKIFFDSGGNLILGPAQGLEDLVSDDVVAKARFYGPQIWRMIKGWSTQSKIFSNQNTASAGKFRNALRLYIAGLERSHPPPKNMMYVWDNAKGTIARVPKKRFHRLFRNSTKYGMQVEFPGKMSYPKTLAPSHKVKPTAPGIEGMWR